MLIYGDGENTQNLAQSTLPEEKRWAEKTKPVFHPLHIPGVAVAKPTKTKHIC